ncbi:MAG: phosphate transporter permease subunit PstC [Methanomassiliicoccales archaeon PtaB.Bin215]|jgi:phosphate ABC transporter permease protein PstC|nr:MAG: phosphate transporter permease subunit PstC [Methanomassiliicoccales archaeon PtaB.Bin215]
MVKLAFKSREKVRRKVRKNTHLSPREKVIQLALTMATWTSVLALGAVFGELLLGALPAFYSINIIDFFTGTVWNPSHPMYPLYGVLPLFVGTLMVSFGAALIAIPIGLGCTIWLAELAHPRLKAVFKPAIEVLAGIPSVIFGFFALVILSEWISLVFDPVTKLNALNGAIMLAVMMIPIMVTVAEDAMHAVPNSLREASLALGATRWETIRHVVLPASVSGIVAAIVLGFGRAVGETMTVLMATGNAPMLHFDLLRSVQTMTAAIAIDFGEVEFYSEHYHVLFLVGLVLFIITFVINFIADWVTRRYREEY